MEVLGKELQIGDIVAYNPPHYKGLKLGKVIKLTEKRVRVSEVYKVGTDPFGEAQYRIHKTSNILVYGDVAKVEFNGKILN